MLINDENLKLKSSLWLLLGSLVVTSLIGCGSLSSKAEPPAKPMPLFGDLGTHHYPVSTSVPAAQRYFDQGLILAFGFNHSEAARSFREAYRLDSDCALCYWGEALVLGPNINAPMDPSVVPQAYMSLQQSLVLANSATDKEQVLISALAKRYSETAPTDRRPLDEAYAAAMRGVARRFPGVFRATPS